MTVPHMTQFKSGLSYVFLSLTSIPPRVTEFFSPSLCTYTRGLSSLGFRIRVSHYLGQK